MRAFRRKITRSISLFASDHQNYSVSFLISVLIRVYFFRKALLFAINSNERRYDEKDEAAKSCEFNSTTRESFWPEKS